ncbi:hypothetical protein GOBAR_AA03168 [Gossypium barbadense]|uniref:Uncharacterized protein n=1 Tax=Gossypium barbadense TaxID=3634 RepID=A0A2P5YPF5_GOSBA|nr:hypothetical protein GOBAR_AA03168 [Gossypium barbadense]
MKLFSMFYLQTVMTNYDDPGTVQFYLGRLIRQRSIPEFSAALGLYTEELKEENELHALSRHIHFSPSKCLHTLAPGAASYNPSCSKASVLPPSLTYLHAILAHTITGKRESTGIFNTHDAYFLWCMLYGHVIDLAYFIALTIQHQTERHKKGSSPLALTLLMLSSRGKKTVVPTSKKRKGASSSAMRMIERHRGTYPPQYRLAQSTEEEAYEDIPNDVPPQHGNPPT